MWGGLDYKMRGYNITGNCEALNRKLPCAKQSLRKDFLGEREQSLESLEVGK